jgi:Zn-dependent oligopeptidase
MHFHGSSLHMTHKQIVLTLTLPKPLQVLSADMFATRFEKEGVMNPKVGMDYRKLVLAPGGTHNITDHLTKFLGRPPSNEAFLKSRGILK